MTKTKCYYNILITENYPSQLLYFVKFIWAQYGKIFKLRIQYWTRANVESNIEIPDQARMDPIGVFLYRTNNPAILTSEYLV